MGRFVDALFHRSALRRWGRAAQDARRLDLESLRALRTRAREMRQRAGPRVAASREAAAYLHSPRALADARAGHAQWGVAGFAPERREAGGELERATAALLRAAREQGIGAWDGGALAERMRGAIAALRDEDAESDARGEGGGGVLSTSAPDECARRSAPLPPPPPQAADAAISPSASAPGAC